MVQILPPVDRRHAGSRFGESLGANLGEGFSKGVELSQENAALKKRGIDVEGLTGETRAQVIAHDLKYGAKKKAAEALREPGYERQDNELVKGEKQDRSSPPIGKNDIEEKKGLYTQKVTQGQLQPVKSAQQVQQEGVEFARNATANDHIMTDQEGIDYANAKNNLAIQSNQRIQGEQQAMQAEKSAFNEKGRKQALNTIGPDNLTPEVDAYFGKRAEILAGEVPTESDLDKELAKEITNYKKAVARAKSTINEPPNSKLGDDSLGEKIINDLRRKLEPILKMGLYDKGRDILAELGYGPEQRETVISNLSESTNKILSEIPTLRTHQKLEHKRGSPLVLRDYSDDQKEVINNTMSKIFKADPSTNITLLRRQMRDEKNIDWRAFKDGLDYAIDTGALTLTDENLDQYSRMSEPEESGLQQILRVFGVGGR